LFLTSEVPLYAQVDALGVRCKSVDFGQSQGGGPAHFIGEPTQAETELGCMVCGRWRNEREQQREREKEGEGGRERERGNGGGVGAHCAIRRESDKW
jgi:hypothetical protein